MAGHSKYFMDKGKLCIHEKIEGQQDKVTVYLDRRCAMSFPSAYNSGYYCLFGVKDARRIQGRYPLILLAEGEGETTASLFKQVIPIMKRYHCKTIFANCANENESAEIEFAELIHRYGVTDIELYDASGFEGVTASYGGFMAAKNALDEYGRKGQIELKTGGKLVQELHEIRADDFKKRPYDHFPAINALNYLIISYIISPILKKRKESTTHLDRKDGYGG